MTTSYDGPRKFSSPPTAQELERLVTDLSDLIDDLRKGPKFPPRIGVERKDCSLEVGASVRVDTSQGQTVRATLPDVRASGGRVAVLVRMSGLGAIDVIPQSGVKVDGIDIYSVSADVFALPFFSDGFAWYSVL